MRRHNSGSPVAERHHHGLRVFAQQAEEPPFRAAASLDRPRAAAAPRRRPAASARRREVDRRVAVESTSLPNGGTRSPPARRPPRPSASTPRRPRAPPPKASSGRVYMFTLKAATAKKLSEMPSARPARHWAPRAAPPWPATTTAASRQTRKRAARAGTPRSTSRSESHPPAKPPSIRRQRRNPGVPRRLRQRQVVHVHQILRRPVGPQRVAHHAERVGQHEGPQAPVAQHVSRTRPWAVSARRRCRHAARRPVPQRESTAGPARR